MPVSSCPLTKKALRDWLEAAGVGAAPVVAAVEVAEDDFVVADLLLPPQPSAITATAARVAVSSRRARRGVIDQVISGPSSFRALPAGPVPVNLTPRDAPDQSQWSAAPRLTAGPARLGLPARLTAACSEHRRCPGHRRGFLRRGLPQMSVTVS